MQEMAILLESDRKLVEDQVNDCQDRMNRSDMYSCTQLAS
jgi:hypothetical protein